MIKLSKFIANVVFYFGVAAAVMFSVHKLSAEVNQERQCLALNIYHEARGESIMGQIAVAHVTLNRVADSRWPSTICEVVYQPKQFSWTHTIENQEPKKGEAWTIAQSLAKDIMNGVDVDNTDGAVYYHADYVNPVWNRNLTVTTKIGVHIFYKD